MQVAGGIKMKRGITLGTMFASSALCLLAVRAIVQHILIIDAYSCKFDPVISEFHKNEIFDFINANKELRAVSLDYLVFKIKDRFKIVKSVKASQSACGILKLDVQAIEPKFIVNEDYVLSQEGALFEEKLFDKDLLSSCKCVTIKQINVTNKLPVFYKEIIYSLPDNSFEQYDIVLESETKSYMYDKSNTKFSILFNGLCVPDEKTLYTCANLKNILESKKLFYSKRVKRWYADVRFKNQIVLCKRGR